MQDARRILFGAACARPQETITERHRTMKTKTSKQPKLANSSVQLKDIKPKKDAKGGGKGYWGFTGGVRVASADVN